MTIVLRDIRDAWDDYLTTEVATTVSPVVPAGPATMNPGELGTFLVIVQNAGDPTGVPLVSLRYHFAEMDGAGGAKYVVPGAAAGQARLTNNSAAAVLAVGTLVDSMFFFPTVTTLAVGGITSLINVQVKAVSLGAVTMKIHVHAAPDQAFLFPSLAGKNGEESFDIV